MTRLAVLMPSNTPGAPSTSKLVRAMGLTQPNQGVMVYRGDMQLTEAHVRSIAARFQVDFAWLAASDLLHEKYPTYGALRDATANEPPSRRDLWSESYLAYDADKKAQWPQRDVPFKLPGLPTGEPYLTMSGCTAELTDFSGEDLLLLQMAITQELIGRKGNQR